MLIIGYEYESALGKKIKKAAICKNEDEYRRMKELIEDVGAEVLEFVEVYNASRVLKWEK